MSTTEEVHYTHREMEVIKLLLLSKNRKTIGGILIMATGTVDNHIKHLFLKTNCHSIEELLVFFFSHGFAVNRERTEVTFYGVSI
ncbi:MAG TPA: helix-turn-helix transcriptional regulator [Bacteroidia bacterium]|nr:helix-turn-helix transcriptional regulator [Bacteroidia bacterium]